MEAASSSLRTRGIKRLRTRAAVMGIERGVGGDEVIKHWWDRVIHY